MYLLDSDHLIDILNGKKELDGVVGKIRGKKLFTSIICVIEVLEGLLNFKEEKKLEQFKEILEAFQVVNIDYQTAEVFAKIRGDLRRKGKLIDNFDLLIASTCLVNDLTLITGNVSHFKRIPRLKIYKEKN